jgi:hypothetical protein
MAFPCQFASQSQVRQEAASGRPSPARKPSRGVDNLTAGDGQETGRKARDETGGAQCLLPIEHRTVTKDMNTKILDHNRFDIPIQVPIFWTLPCFQGGSQRGSISLRKGAARTSAPKPSRNLRSPPLFRNPRDKKVNPPLIVAPKMRGDRNPSQNRIETWGKKREANSQQATWSHSPRTHLPYDQDQRSS